tara:strand:+ start:4669 stop:5694 length:1026 start_codon:yes stop_codon:yes gene_type:complete
MNKQIINLINVQKILELDLIIPNLQREKDNSRIKEIVDYQLNYYKKHKTYNFIGSTLCIAKNIKYNHQYLIDGQHRYYAIKYLIEKKKIDFKIYINIIDITSNEEMIHLFELINKSLPVPKMPTNISNYIPKIVFLYFIKKYKKFFSNSNRPNRPNININIFQEEIGNIIKKYPKLTADKIIDMIECANTLYKKMNQSNFPSKGKRPNEYYLELCKKKGELYLGMFTNYEWIDHIFNGIKPSCFIYKKQTIPKCLKRDIWHKYIGKDKGNGKCYCCQSIIDCFAFEGGHIEAEVNGGKTNLDNLRPICGLCNKSMGSKNMKIFMNKHGYKRKKSFLNIFGK